MIRVERGELADRDEEGILRPVRTDMSPASAEARDVIVRAGSAVEDRLERMGGLPVGGAALTPAGNLDASFLIHAVVASDEEPETALTVRRALGNALRRAVDWGLTSLALPPMGLGVGNLEVEAAARALVDILVDHLDDGHQPLDLVIVVATGYEEEVLGRLVGEMTSRRFPMRN